MSLFAELHRRNVIRVTVAYVVTAWLIVEIGSLLFEIFLFPEWASQLLVILLALGLIPALFFSWAYEITPEGLKRESEVDRTESVTPQTARRLDQITIAVVVLAIGVVVLREFRPVEVPSPPTPEADAPIAAVDPEPVGETKTFDPKSVAVLPFVNMSADPDNEYFSDGISEELLNMLVRIDDLRVPSRTSSFAFKGQNREIREIAESLQVAHVLEGSVRKSGDRVRITAQLIDVATDTHLWSETYDRELTDIFAIQDEIAAEIVKALEVALDTDASQSTTPRDIKAYDHYLQALHYFRIRSAELLPESRRLLEQVVEREPEFAEAWAALSLVHLILPSYTRVPRSEAGPNARAAAERALELNPDLADPRAALAMMMGWEEQWVDVLNAWDQIIADHPRHALSRQWFGVRLLATGYLEEGREHLEIAHQLDPVSGVTMDWLARGKMLTGRTEEAKELARKAVRLGRVTGFVTLTYHYLSRDDVDGAFAEFEAMGSPLPQFTVIVDGVREPERRPEIREQLPSAPSMLRHYFDFTTAMYLKLPEEFFPAVEVVMTFDNTVTFGLWGKRFSVLRQHPLMKQFAKDHGFLELWRTRGWPDRCRPAGEEDFECD